MLRKWNVINIVFHYKKSHALLMETDPCRIKQLQTFSKIDFSIQLILNFLWTPTSQIFYFPDKMLSPGNFLTYKYIKKSDNKYPEWDHLTSTQFQEIQLEAEALREGK